MNRPVLYSAIAFLVLGAALVVSMFSAGYVSAQDGTSATSTPAGKLVVVPQDLEVGQTTQAVGFHVSTRDQDVEIRYSGHFVPEGESCAAAVAGSTTSATSAPVTVKLVACSEGSTHVRPVASDTGLVIREVDVNIAEPGASGQQAIPVVALSNVPPRLLPGTRTRSMFRSQGSPSLTS